jgi:plastocyanin
MASTLSRIACALLAAVLIAACGSSSSPASTVPTTAPTHPAATPTAAATTASTHPAATPTAAATSASTASKPVSGAVTVSIKNYMFMPMSLTVKAGTKVTFHNDDQTTHTATANNGAFDTGNVAPGKSVTVTMTKTGVAKYHCAFHAFMMATITVVPN